MAVYKLKDVMLSMRNKYKENQRALNGLKKYVSITNRDKDDYRFSLNQSANEISIKLELLKNKNLLKRISDSFHKSKTNVLIGFEDDGERRYLVLPKCKTFDSILINH